MLWLKNKLKDICSRVFSLPHYDGIKKLFFEHSLIVILIVLSYLATLALNLLLARILTRADYADFSVVMQILTFTVPFALLGTELSMMRFLPIYLDTKDYARFSGFLRWSFKVFISTTLIVLGVGFALATGTEFLDDLGAIHFSKYHAIIYTVWLIPPFSMTVYLSILLQVLKKQALSTALNGVITSIVIGVFILSFLSTFDSTWIGAYRAFDSVLVCFGLGLLMVIAIEVLMIQRLLPKEVLKIQPQYDIHEWSVNSYQMMSSTVVFGTLSAIDIFLLRILDPKLDQVGYFSAALVLASALVIFASSVDLIVNPLISPAIEKKEHGKIQTILNTMNLFKLVPSALLGCVFILFGPWMLELFGKGFSGGYEALVILTIGFFVGTCLNSSGPLLLYSGYQKLSFYISLMQIGFIIIFDAVLIPMYGMNAAALVLSLSIILSALIRVYFCRKELGIKVFYLI